MKNKKDLKLKNELRREKMLVKTDGNGGVIINKALLGLLTFILLVITTLVTVVAFSAGLSSDLKHTQERLDQQTADLRQIVARVDSAERSISSVDADISNMKENLAEIRSDIKTLLRNTGG